MTLKCFCFVLEGVLLGNVSLRGNNYERHLGLFVALNILNSTFLGWLRLSWLLFTLKEGGQYP